MFVLGFVFVFMINGVVPNSYAYTYGEVVPCGDTWSTDYETNEFKDGSICSMDGSLDLDPDLSPSYALDFAGGSAVHIFSGFAAFFVIILSLFLVPYFILKRKNIPSRPYMSLIFCGVLLYFGLPGLIIFLIYLPSTLDLTRNNESLLIETLVISLWIPIITLSVAGILLYRSSIIKKLLKN